MIEIWTFGFKYGFPQCNVIFDVTFLPNPARLAGKRLDDELDDEMTATIQGLQAATELTRLISSVAEMYVETGMETRLAIGCSSGRHRSRVVASMVREELRTRGVASVLHHREDSRPTMS